jgi:dihydrofolate reductase
MKITLVVAASENNAIGKDNNLLWHLPKDMRFFKNTTWGLPILMGRKTFESLGSKLLPGRVNIILTQQKEWTAEGVRVVHSMQELSLIHI